MLDTAIARKAILARLRAVKLEPEDIRSNFSVVEKKKWAGDNRLKTFRQGMESVNGEVIDCTREGWPESLKKLLMDEGIKSLSFGPGGPLSDGIHQAAKGSGCTLVPYDKNIEDFKETLFDIDAGITSTLGGIVETGTLALWPNETEPRLLSLVPPIHIALLDASKLHNTFLELMRTENWAQAMPTNALLVTGPSKTADIEQTLIFGVHGPKRLIVLAITD